MIGVVSANVLVFILVIAIGSKDVDILSVVVDMVGAMVAVSRMLMKIIGSADVVVFMGERVACVRVAVIGSLLLVIGSTKVDATIFDNMASVDDVVVFVYVLVVASAKIGKLLIVIGSREVVGTLDVVGAIVDTMGVVVA